MRVIISGLLEQEGARDAVHQFCKGFGSKVQLTSEEISAIPVLMTLRKVDVFLHFMTRYLNGTDAPDVLRQQTQSRAADLHRLANDILWIEEVLRNEFEILVKKL